MNISKRFNLLILLFVCLLSQLRAEPLSDYINSPEINADKTSVLIIDLKNKRIVASHNADLPLIPASIMKSVTTATLLDKTGSKFTYETKVYYTGSINNNILSGDLIIKASGDPSVNSKYDPLKGDFVSEIVNKLDDLGVKQITGSIVIDESDFPGEAINPTWQKEDLQHSYGTGTHGFNYKDNASEKKSVADPAAVFISCLKSQLAGRGIETGAAAVNASGKRKELFTHYSAQIDELMRSCMMRSDNQYAEAMVRLIGLKYGQSGSVATGVEEEMKYWKTKHANMDGVRIFDGSGLSKSNRVTARFMADVLRIMSPNPYYASFFPLAGEEGTMRRFLAGTELQGGIAMKTGSMKGIQCFAGYKLDDNFAPTHVVVIMMNNMADRSKARAATEKLLRGVFELEK